MTTFPLRTTAAVVPSTGAPFELREIDLVDLRDDEVLVRVEAAGLCHTDVALAASYPDEMMPIVLGHEGAGVVEAVGPAVEGIAVGDHVVMSLRSCRACSQCTGGHVGYCERSVELNYMCMRPDFTHTYAGTDGSTVFGSFFGQSSFARHAVAYADNCVVVDGSVDLALTAPFGCGYQTGAGTVLNVLQSGPEDSLLVLGAGAVGLAALAAAAGRGVGTLVAVDLLPERREAAARYGAVGVDPREHAGDDPADDTALVTHLKELTGGGATYAVDTTSLPGVVRSGMRALAPRGTLVALGLGEADYTVDPVDLLQGGKTLRSSIEGESDPQTAIPELVRLRSEGRFDVDPLVRTYPFADIATAVEDVHAGRTVKAVLTW